MAQRRNGCNRRSSHTSPSPLISWNTDGYIITSPPQPLPPGTQRNTNKGARLQSTLSLEGRSFASFLKWSKGRAVDGHVPCNIVTIFSLSEIYRILSRGVRGCIDSVSYRCEVGAIAPILLLGQISSCFGYYRRVVSTLGFVVPSEIMFRMPCSRGNPSGLEWK